MYSNKPDLQKNRLLRLLRSYLQYVHNKPDLQTKNEYCVSDLQTEIEYCVSYLQYVQ
jgi:hypothetical protein